MRDDEDAYDFDPADVARAQNALLRAALAARNDEKCAEAAATSLAPWAPTEPRRRAVAFDACALSSSDVLYDLGCGDGRVLVDAAKARGCRCVGLELDDALVRDARERVARENLEDLITVHEGDLTALTAEALARGVLDSPAPTCAFAWLTGAGLRRLSPTLRRAWEIGDFRIVTCVDALDACVDFERDGAFAEPDDSTPWEVRRDRAADFGVFVVPRRARARASVERANRNAN